MSPRRYLVCYGDERRIVTSPLHNERLAIQDAAETAAETWARELDMRRLGQGADGERILRPILVREYRTEDIAGRIVGQFEVRVAIQRTARADAVCLDGGGR